MNILASIVFAILDTIILATPEGTPGRKRWKEWTQPWTKQAPVEEKKLPPIEGY